MWTSPLAGRRNRKTKMGRRRSLEKLEHRQLLASDLHNVYQPFDVTDDMNVTPLDALVVINHIRRNPIVGESVSNRGVFPDVDQDGEVTPLDALKVINGLRRNTSFSVLGIEKDSAPGGTTNRDGVTSDLVIQGRINDLRSIEDKYSVRVLGGYEAIEKVVPAESIDDHGQFRLDLNEDISRPSSVNQEFDLKIELIRVGINNQPQVISKLNVRYDRLAPRLIVNPWVGKQRTDFNIEVTDGTQIAPIVNQPALVDAFDGSPLLSEVTTGFDGQSASIKIQLPARQFGPEGSEPVSDEAQGRTFWIDGEIEFEDLAGNIATLPNSIFLRRFDDSTGLESIHQENGSLTARAGEFLRLSPDRVHRFLSLKVETIDELGARQIHHYATENFAKVGLSGERVFPLNKYVVAASLVNQKGEVVETVEITPANEVSRRSSDPVEFKVDSAIGSIRFVVPINESRAVVIGELGMGQLDLETGVSSSIVTYPKTTTLSDAQTLGPFGGFNRTNLIVRGDEFVGHAIVAEGKSVAPDQQYLLVANHRWLEYWSLSSGQMVASAKVPDRFDSPYFRFVYDPASKRLVSLSETLSELVYFDPENGREVERKFFGAFENPGSTPSFLALEPLTRKLHLVQGAYLYSQLHEWDDVANRFVKIREFGSPVSQTRALSFLSQNSFKNTVVVNNQMLTVLKPDLFPVPSVDRIKTSAIAGVANDPDLPAVHAGGLIRIEGQNLRPEMSITVLEVDPEYRSWAHAEFREATEVYPIAVSADGTWAEYSIPENALGIDLNFDQYARRFGHTVESSVASSIQVVPLAAFMPSAEYIYYGNNNLQSLNDFWWRLNPQGVDEAHYQMKYDGRLVSHCGLNELCQSLTHSESLSHFGSTQVPPEQSIELTSQGGTDLVFLPPSRYLESESENDSVMVILDRTIDLATRYESLGETDSSETVSTGQEISFFVHRSSIDTYRVVFDNSDPLAALPRVQEFPHTQFLYGTPSGVPGIIGAMLTTQVPLGFHEGTVRIYRKSLPNSNPGNRKDDRVEIVFEKFISVRPTVIASSGQSTLADSSVVLAGTNLLGGVWMVDGIEVVAEDLSDGAFPMGANASKSIDQQLTGMDLVRIRIPSGVSQGVIERKSGELTSVFGEVQPWWDGPVPQPSQATAFDSSLPVLTKGDELRVRSTGQDQEWNYLLWGDLWGRWTIPVADNGGQPSLPFRDNQSVWFARKAGSDRFGILFIAPGMPQVQITPGLQNSQSISFTAFEVGPGLGHYYHSGPTQYQWGDSTVVVDNLSRSVVMSPGSTELFPDFNDDSPLQASRTRWTRFPQDSISFFETGWMTGAIDSLPSGDLTVRSPWAEVTVTTQDTGILQSMRARSGVPHDPSLPSMNGLLPGGPPLGPDFPMIIPVRASDGQGSTAWAAIANLASDVNPVTGMFRESPFAQPVFVQIVPVLVAQNAYPNASADFRAHALDETSTAVIGSKVISIADIPNGQTFSLLQERFHGLTLEDLRAGIYVTSRGGRSDTLPIPFLESVTTDQTRVTSPFIDTPITTVRPGDQVTLNFYQVPLGDALSSRPSKVFLRPVDGQTIELPIDSIMQDETSLSSSLTFTVPIHYEVADVFREVGDNVFRVITEAGFERLEPHFTSTLLRIQS